MDMDSTAIQIECIDEIAKLAGTGELVSEVTERRCAASWTSPPACASAWRR
jgi:phosphoserine phosphatase